MSTFDLVAPDWRHRAASMLAAAFLLAAGGAHAADAPRGRDVARCLRAADSLAAEERQGYCASLSPASRRARCAEHVTDSVEESRARCLVEWQTMPSTALEGLTPALDGDEMMDCDPENPCCPGSPIVIDTAGDGFDLTDRAHGVRFDLRANGQPEQFGWTSPMTDDAWLVLDRNGNGAIDDGSEMFGNYTAQPESASPNGFIALAEFDLPNAGGNADSRIDASDAIYLRLRLWLDRNHNGFSEALELSALPKLGVRALSLDYSVSNLRDEHGNQFRYRADVVAAPGLPIGPFAYDVFLVGSRTPTATNFEPASSGSGTWSCGATCEQLPKPPYDQSSCPSPLIAIGSSFGRDAACEVALFRCREQMDPFRCVALPLSEQCRLCRYFPPPEEESCR